MYVPGSYFVVGSNFSSSKLFVNQIVRRQTSVTSCPCQHFFLRKDNRILLFHYLVFSDAHTKRLKTKLWTR